jgi:hypothetical protein
MTSELEERKGRMLDAVGSSRRQVLAIAPATVEESDVGRPSLRNGRVVAFRRTAATAERREHSSVRPPAPADAETAPEDSVVPGDEEVAKTPIPPPPPPRWLASELLSEKPIDRPYDWTARTLSAVSGLAGAAGAVMFAENGLDLFIVALFAGLAVLAMLPIPFLPRAGGFAVFGLGGLVYATWLRIEAGEGEWIGLATLGPTLLAAAQLFRAVHRGSRFAHTTMLLGIGLTASWMLLDGGLHGLVVTDLTLDGWIGPATRAALVVVLAMSLLAFLDNSGDSGCRVWPWLVLAWIACSSAGSAILERGPVVAVVATPLFAAVAALGWMQVWAVTPGLGSREVSPRGGASTRSTGPSASRE